MVLEKINFYMKRGILFIINDISLFFEGCKKKIKYGKCGI